MLQQPLICHGGKSPLTGYWKEDPIIGFPSELSQVSSDLCKVENQTEAETFSKGEEPSVEGQGDTTD